MRDVATANQQPSETSLDLQLLLGPPLLEGEDPAAYEALRRQIQSAVAPADVFDEIWVRDIADRLWETFRCDGLR